MTSKIIGELFGNEGVFYWRDALKPLSVRRWKREWHGFMSTSWSGWTCVRVFGFRIALIQAQLW